MMTATPTPNDISCINVAAPAAFATSGFEKTSDNLIYLLQQKSEKGFSILYDNYADALLNILFSVVKNSTIAEDLLQDTFVKIWTKIHTYDNTKGSLYTWMLNITKNTAIDFIRLRKNQFHKQLIQDDILCDERFQPCSDTNNTDRLDYIAIKKKVAVLDKKYAEVLDMIYFEGCTYEQAATILQLPLGTVKTRARKALTLLKNGYQ